MSSILDIVLSYIDPKSHFGHAIAFVVAYYGRLVRQLSTPPQSTLGEESKVVECKSTLDVTPHNYVQDIITESGSEWVALINHPYPRDLAKGTAPLNGFRHYCIQDAGHFEYFYRSRMEAMGRTGTFQEIEDFARILAGGLAAVTKARDDCTTKLGVKESVVKKEPDSKALQDFAGLVSSAANKGDYLDVVITLLPGILSYDRIAKELLRDPNTVKNTPYFSLWVELYSKNPIKKHTSFVNNHIASMSEEERHKRWKGWINNFKIGCKYERDFFALGTSNKYPAYEIVSNGIYRIRSCCKGNPYLVGDESSSVATQEDEPGKEGMWRLTNSPDGYVIENVGQNGFLNVSVGNPQQVHSTCISSQAYQWSINPVEGFHEAYHLFVPTQMQYVLDAGNKEDGRKVAVENSDAERPTQSWLLERVPEDYTL